MKGQGSGGRFNIPITLTDFDNFTSAFDEFTLDPWSPKTEGPLALSRA